jgi:hypothetical protein
MVIEAYNPDQESFGTIPAVESDLPAPPSAPVVEDRAKKANFGLEGKIQETYPDIFKQISDGQEQMLRDSISRQIAYKNILNRNSVISGIASQINRPLTPDDLDTIDRKLAEPNHPQAVIEDHFALKYMGYIDHGKDNPDDTSWVKTVQKEWPNEFEAYRKLGTNSIATTQLLNTRLQDVSKVIEDESTLSKIWNFAKQQVPGYPEYNLSRLVEGAGMHMGLGSSLEDQALNFYRMSRQQQIETLDKAHESLKGNPELEATFLAGLIGQSTSEKMLNNLSMPLNALILSDVGSAVKGAAKAAFPALAVRDLVNGMAKSVDQMAAEIAAPAAAGDLGKAAVNRASDQILADMTNADPRRKQVEGLVDFWKGKKEEFEQNPGNYAAELTNQMVEAYEVNPQLLIARLTNMMRVERVPALRAMQTLTEAFSKHVADYLPGVDNKILNMSVPYKKGSLSGNTYVDVHLGNQYTKYFEQPGSADAYAKIHNIPEYSVEQAGSGYYIKISMPWDETHPLTRNLIADGIKTDAYGTKTPESLFTRFLGGIMTPEETMSTFAATQRGIATFGPNRINGIAHVMGKDLEEAARGTFPFTAKRQKWNDLKRVMQSGQHIYDPAKPDTPGYTFKNPGELEYAFRKTVGYSPDPVQVKAYFSWKMLGELDWTLRNLSVLRNKTRVGTMSHTIRVKGPDGDLINSEPFDGIPQNNVPVSGSVLVMGDKIGEERILTAASLREGTELGKRLRSNNPTDKLQIVKIYDQGSRPLEGFGTVKDERIQYVVGRFTKKNLEFHQLPERGGGHFIYDYPAYLKQGIISQELKSEAVLDKDGFETKPAKYNTILEGEKTLLAVRTRAEGKELERRFDGFRVLLRDKKYDEAKQFLIDNPLPYDYSDLYEKFKPKPVRNKSTGRMTSRKAELSLDEPIRLMDANTRIGDAFANEYKQKYGKSFIDGAESGDPAQQNQVAFTGERDVRELMSIVDEGGKGNPVFKLQPAQLIDPMTAMNRGLRNIANSFFFDDLKIGFMEHWLQEAAPFMNLKKNELQNAGFRLFHNPKWLNKPTLDQADRIKQLEITRSQHLTLVSRPGEQESFLMSAAQHLADAIYTKAGPKFVISPLSIMSMAKSGPEFLRNVAFHFKLGNFNPSQLIKQMNTWATIYGIEGPARASQGAAAAMMHELTRINDNPEVIAHMSKMLEKFNWRPGEFQEFRDLLQNTGFDTVAGEYAGRDSIWSGNVYSNGFNRFLSLGTSFFTEGERNVRYGAFATAYRKFRDANPTGALSEADKEVILQRARLLNVNMDRAANAIWQHGLSSIPFQFQTYALRTAQLMIGKQLTGTEKLRLFATYGALYGMPITAGLVGLPIADNLRKLAIDNGYKVGDGYIQNTLMEGIPAMMAQMITGQNYNIGQAYGPSGMMNISPTLRSDQAWWQILLESAAGPSGSIIANTIANSDGLYRWAVNIQNDTFPFQWEDVVRSWKEISTVRRGDQVRQALESSNWYSTRGEKLATDVNPMDAVFMFLSGLDHQQVQDGYLVGQLSSSRKAYNEYTEKIFTENWRAGIRAHEYNPTQADQYFSRAGTILKSRGYPREDYAQLFAKATKDYETLADRMNKEYNMHHLPSGSELQYKERYLNKGNQ